MKLYYESEARPEDWRLQLRIAFALLLGMSLVAINLGTWSNAQSTQELAEYMLEHRRTLYEAAEVLDLDATDAFGGMESETWANHPLLFASCVEDAGPVGLFGDATAIGLSASALREYVQNQLDSKLYSLPSCTLQGRSGRLRVWIEVWAVGTDYPSALHIELKTMMPSLEMNLQAADYDEPFETASLGVGSPRGHQETVRALRASVAVAGFVFVVLVGGLMG